jgi:hypothetical protein
MLAMEVRILDLDGSMPSQRELMASLQPRVIRMQEWGPRIRLACSFRRFRAFEKALVDLMPAGRAGSTCTFYGSGDFHHVTLALLKRLDRPFNLLVVDNHPDWMRRIPFLHCGTWVDHAARLPHCQRIFHVGGDVDFDNAYRHLAPWHELRCGKIITMPARRGFVRGSWREIACDALRDMDDERLSPRRLEERLRPFRTVLGYMPLYITVDKDVLRPEAACVNWDSGHLSLAEVCDVVRAFSAAAGPIAGIDILGDWSPVDVEGAFRRLMHLAMHEHRVVDPRAAARCNQRANLALLSSILDARATRTIVRAAA